MINTYEKQLAGNICINLKCINGGVRWQSNIDLKLSFETFFQGLGQKELKITLKITPNEPIFNATRMTVFQHLNIFEHVSPHIKN